ncbi:thiamine phosphate synthase [Brevundimonas sp.]|uniref:thiamine phosphate synthase n=1 Tax=Brevundimonas sp. TaxID=1871086 RepID=UPI004034654B
MSVTDASLDVLSDEGRALWTAALALARAAAPVSPEGRPVALPPLLFFTDPIRMPEPWTTAARLPAGSAVVYRHFGTAGAEATARRLREVTTHRGVRLLIGLDADLAGAVGADGVHLPERARNRASDLRQTCPDWLITTAAHPDGDLDAATSGIDALVLSPIFPTNSPSPPRSALGVEGLAEAVRRSTLPVYALGGIDVTNVGALAGTGACGIAGVEAFNRAFGV